MTDCLPGISLRCPLQGISTAPAAHMRACMLGPQADCCCGCSQVALYCDCPFWPDDGMCMLRDCSVCECEDEEVPAPWKEQDSGAACDCACAARWPLPHLCTSLAVIALGAP